MNCDCIKEIEAKIIEAYPVYNNKKVVDVKMDKIFTFNPTDIRTSTNVMIEVEGQKKKYDVGMTHTFCPYCGIKQSKD
jgi:hypothetical protein